MSEITITVVPDESIACPGCGAYWGHPDPALDHPNRFKVDTFCRCYNPRCPVLYYDPYIGEVEVGTCEWFAACGNPATTVLEHPVLTLVPACERCAGLATS